MTQADLARKTGLTTSNVAYIVNGKTKDPRLSSVIAIAQALNVSLNYLVGE
jgi:transcriptional regulator with XRE-family HTH domain